MRCEVKEERGSRADLDLDLRLRSTLPSPRRHHPLPHLFQLWLGHARHGGRGGVEWCVDCRLSSSSTAVLECVRKAIGRLNRKIHSIIFKAGGDGKGAMDGFKGVHGAIHLTIYYPQGDVGGRPALLYCAMQPI